LILKKRRNRVDYKGLEEYFSMAIGSARKELEGKTLGEFFKWVEEKEEEKAIMEGKKPPDWKI
jgi:hypothetical protein